MSSNRRIRRSAEQWQQIIDEQAGSGLSQIAFCERKGIALSTFAHWKRRLSSAVTDSDANDSKRSSPWIDLGALAGSASGWDIELDLGGGVCLRLRRC
jgi:hypothetical protein